MKFVADTLKYIFKNFIYLLGFVIIPLLFTCSFINVFNVSTFFADYLNTKIVNFETILNVIFNFTFRNALNTFFSVCLILVCISAMLGFIEYHFRSGVKNAKEINSYINNNLLICLVYFLITLIIFFIYKFALSLVIFIFHIIFSGLSNTPNLFTYIFNMSASIILFAVFAYFLCYILISVPITINSGYTIRTSLSSADELLNKKLVKLFIAVVIPFIIIFPVGIISSYFNVISIVNYFLMLLLLLYYPVLMYVSYFDLSFFKRNDIKKKLFK